MMRWWRRCLLVARMLWDRRHGQATLGRPVKGSSAETTTLHVWRCDVQVVVIWRTSPSAGRRYAFIVLLRGAQRFRWVRIASIRWSAVFQAVSRVILRIDRGPVMEVVQLVWIMRLVVVVMQRHCLDDVRVVRYKGLHVCT